MSAEAELAALEQSVLTASETGSYLDRVSQLRLLVMQDAPSVRAIVLSMVAPHVEQEALDAIREAFGIGRDDALTLVDSKTALKKSARSRPSVATNAIVRGLDAAGLRALGQAQRLAMAGADPATYTAPIFGHANALQGRVTAGINSGGNAGSTRVADLAGLPTVWIAETNACVHCLAYSGRVAKPGEDFPGGLTYGKKSYHPDPLAHPPLHPNCRCTVEPLNDQSYADALRREADRSVLRGFSLESESMGVRVDAARRLLEQGVDAPKSVQAFARRAVKAGTFPTRGRG